MTAYNSATFDGYVASGAELRAFRAWLDLLHAGPLAPEIAGASPIGPQRPRSRSTERD